MNWMVLLLILAGTGWGFALALLARCAKQERQIAELLDQVENDLLIAEGMLKGMIEINEGLDDLVKQGGLR